MASLSANDREFLALVRRSTFRNPFSLARDEADRAIASEASRDDIEVLDAARERIRQRVEPLLENRALSSYDQPDAEALLHAVLFLAFHDAAPALDALIAEQRGRQEPVAVPFAAALLRGLQTKGIPEHRAQRALELFYQMRRAFIFIRDGLAGESASMRTLRESLWDHVFTHDVLTYERLLWDRMEDFSTLLVGETGTGKGAAATALGRSGFIAWDPSRGRFETSFESQFVAANLSEFSESLVESELFGHKRGAFTGAIDAHVGLFGQCPPHGVIFLDEIGELSPSVQIKLLRVLQERSFRPVGDRREQRFEGRVVAATHAPLDALRAEGRFRDDLFYRLCSAQITVPSLRARLRESPDELGHLVRALLPRIVGPEATTAELQELQSTVLEAIRRDIPNDHPWPGNVRELEQVVRRVLLTGDAERPRRASEDARPSWVKLAEAGDLDARTLLEAYCEMLYRRLGSYEEVGRRAGLDRRTVKRHIQSAQARGGLVDGGA